MTSTWWSPSSTRFCWCWRPRFRIVFILSRLSGSSIFWGSSSRHYQQEDMSWGSNEKWRGDGEGRVYITHGHTLCTRHAHARNSPEERAARWTCVRSTLGVRPRCARCAPTAVDEHTTHAQRVPRVCRALAQRALRMAGVLLACIFMRRAPRTVLCMHKNPDAHNERRRMHSVGPARSTHE